MFPTPLSVQEGHSRNVDLPFQSDLISLTKTNKMVSLFPFPPALRQSRQFGVIQPDFYSSCFQHRVTWQ